MTAGMLYSANCSFLKYSMLSMTRELSYLRADMDLLCLMGLALTIIVIFTNLTACILGSFRAASSTYDEEVKKLKDDISKGVHEDILSARNVLPIKGLIRRQLKQMKKDGSGTQINGTLVAQNILTPIQAQIGFMEDQPDPNLKYKTLKKKIPQSSKLYNSTYFQAKNKVAPARPGDVSKALIDLQDKNKRVKINEIDEQQINKFRDMGLLSEFNKPLRNYLVEDTVTSNTKNQNKNKNK